MKKYLEMFFVISILFSVVYSLLYFYYFDSFCKNFSWRDENNVWFAIHKMASCKDSVVCVPNNIQTNKKNEVNYWDCEKKIFPLFSEE